MESQTMTSDLLKGIAGLTPQELKIFLIFIMAEQKKGTLPPFPS